MNIATKIAETLEGMTQIITKWPGKRSHSVSWIENQFKSNIMTSVKRTYFEYLYYPKMYHFSLSISCFFFLADFPYETSY